MKKIVIVLFILISSFVEGAVKEKVFLDSEYNPWFPYSKYGVEKIKKRVVEKEKGLETKMDNENLIIEKDPDLELFSGKKFLLQKVPRTRYPSKKFIEKKLAVPKKMEKIGDFDLKR